MSTSSEQKSENGASVTSIGTPIALPDLIHDYPDLHRVDVIGDLHGCYDELVGLLERLGHGDMILEDRLDAPEPRVIFVGDLVDRGDRNLDTFDLVVELVERGEALCVIGNHDRRFARWLRGDDVALTHGLADTVAEFEQLTKEEQRAFRQRALAFYDSLPSAIRFDGGRAVVVHAAWRPGMKVEENPKKVYYYAMYGPTTGRKTPEGYPERLDWASKYRGPEHVVFGHQVYKVPYINPFATGIDTGCVFGGGLTALRWPEKELVTEPSRYARAEYGRPMFSGGE